jgi:hypothetical protein
MSNTLFLSPAVDRMGISNGDAICVLECLMINANFSHFTEFTSIIKPKLTKSLRKGKSFLTKIIKEGKTLPENMKEEIERLLDNKNKNDLEKCVIM